MAMDGATGGDVAADAGVAATGRFAAFSFVDRITGLVPGARVLGHYWIPEAITAFPQALAAEAVGQLAAWAAMAQFDFRIRPVAGLAQEIVYHDACRPGHTLDLAVDLESCTQEAIAYSGTAAVGGRLVLELKHSVGPMLPMADFDDPERMRADFALLRGEGRLPGRFGGVDAPLGTLLRQERGVSIEARLAVPAQAPFFADHFPRRPVFPATLLMNALAHWALQLAKGAGDRTPRLAGLANVKMRNWILPGQIVELRVEGQPAADGNTAMKLSARSDGRPLATARATVMTQGQPS